MESLAVVIPERDSKTEADIEGEEEEEKGEK